jgi:hypothetical protein
VTHTLIPSLPCLTLSIVEVGPPRPVDGRYVDLPPGEDLLIDLLTGSHSLTNLNVVVNGIPERADR